MATALITGASSGIGKALAHRFAKEGFDIIACSDNQESLTKACEELRAAHPDVTVTDIAVDLSHMNGPQTLYDQVKKSGVQVDALVNDAGVGFRAPFAEQSLENLDETIHLNVRALVMLTRLYLPEMLERDSGYILQLGSIAGFQPGPLMATYHATKAFVVSLCDSMQEELKDSNVTLTCLCPGATNTAFFERGDMGDANIHDPSQLMEPEAVADAAFAGLMAGERTVIPGLMNKAMVFSRRIMPRAMEAKLGRSFYESSEEEV